MTGLNDGLVRLWFAKPEAPPRAAWADRLELGVVIAVNAVLWALVVVKIYATVDQVLAPKRLAYPVASTACETTAHQAPCRSDIAFPVLRFGIEPIRAAVPG